ncbi:MAG: hypothetical protein NVSMB17_01590 [Candidatus Dormibacteria bacterium]
MVPLGAEALRCAGVALRAPGMSSGVWDPPGELGPGWGFSSRGAVAIDGREVVARRLPTTKRARIILRRVLKTALKL